MSQVAFCFAALLSVVVPSTPQSMRRLVLVRHGAVARHLADPIVRPGALYGGNFDVPLSETGQAEAEAAANFIATQPFARDVRFVCSSPMSRALFGAKRIASLLSPQIVGGLKVETNEFLREVDRGDWANRTVAEVEADPRYGPGAHDKCALDPDYGRVVVNGEGMGDMRERVLCARDYVLSGTRPGSASVVVSHMWVTRIILAEALAMKNVLELDVPTASISIIDYPMGSWPISAADANSPAVVELSGFKPTL